MLVKEIYHLINQYGSRENLARHLKVHVSRISKLLSGGYASLTLAVKLDVLSKGQIPAEVVLAYVDELFLSNAIKKLKSIAQQEVINGHALAYFVKKPLVSIEESESLLLYFVGLSSVGEKMRPLVIDEYHRLVWGQHQIKHLKAQGSTTAEMLVVNLADLLEKREPIMTPYVLTVLERFGIACALESRLHEIEKKSCPAHDAVDLITPHFNNTQRTLKKEEMIAELSQLGSESTYKRLKYIVQQGSQELLNALDKKQISIYRAHRIVRLPSSKQQAALSDFLQHTIGHEINSLT